MSHLKITIQATIQLPRKPMQAAQLGMAVNQIAAETERKLDRLIEPGAPPPVIEVEVADDTTVALPPTRQKPGRKPRAALGSSPLVHAQQEQTAPPVTHRNSSAGDPQAGQPQTISAAAVDGVSRQTALSPEAGADPGPLSDLAAAALRQVGRS